MINNIIIPYSSKKSGEGSKWVFRYWSVDNRLSLISDTKFEIDDVVELVSVDKSRHEIIISPQGIKGSQLPNNHDIPTLIIVSNDIPLNADDDYRFTFNFCTEILTMETVVDGNKIYTFAVALWGESGSITAICDRSKSKLTFHLERGLGRNNG